MDAIGRGESGTREEDVGGQAYQYAYYPLANLDWYYIAVSEVDRMVATTEKVETSDPRRVVAAATVAPSLAVAPPPAPAPPPTTQAGATPDASGSDEADAAPPQARP